ncbi:hypothetical protein [Jeotgalibaca porci]|uniref:hypothetical protein n=1 Tax=Jeotgalibaca porci TaxID=1868793 RepID=UPI0035A1AD55
MRKFTVTVYHLMCPKTKHLIYAANAIEAKYIAFNHFSLVDEQVRHIEVEVLEVLE